MVSPKRRPVSIVGAGVCRHLRVGPSNLEVNKKKLLGAERAIANRGATKNLIFLIRFPDESNAWREKQDLTHHDRDPNATA